jgi:DNA-binding NtrC family response regulator
MAGTLLIIDDDDASCLLIKAIFGAEGINVAAAHDGQSGIDRARTERPDLILLDLRLPGLLLRVLESRQVQPVGADTSAVLDVRFVAATSHDLQVRAAEGQFRADLYFRLAQYTITLPALKDRPVDIPYLAHRFLAEVSVRRAISDALRSARGNKSQAARALDTDYKTLHLKMKRFGVRGRDFVP